MSEKFHKAIKKTKLKKSSFSDRFFLRICINPIISTKRSAKMSLSTIKSRLLLCQAGVPNTLRASFFFIWRQYKVCNNNKTVIKNNVATGKQKKYSFD